MNAPSLAYKFAVLQLLLGDVNHVSQQLELPGSSVKGIEQVRYLYVAPPTAGFCANLKTTNYAFGYAQGARSVRLLAPSGRDYEGWFLSQYTVWAQTPSQIDTNVAYQMASQWLAKVSVDVPALELAYRATVSQLEVAKEALPKAGRKAGSKSQRQKLPVFYVRWGDGQYHQFGKPSISPAIEVVILGTTKQLLELRIMDDVFVRRPKMLVAHADEIARLPDGPILQQMQGGTNLVAISNLLNVPREHELARKSSMCEAVNRYLPRLNLWGETHLSDPEELGGYVWPPAFGNGGTISTKSFRFRFQGDGKLVAVEPLLTSDFDIAGKPVIGTNDAYLIASNRLETLGVSVSQLESNTKARVWRRSLPARGDKPRTLLASFGVAWETDSQPEIEMWLHAVTGETLRLSINNSPSGSAKQGLQINPAQLETVAPTGAE